MLISLGLFCNFIKNNNKKGYGFWFWNDYDLIEEDDVFNFLDLDEFKPSKKITIQIVHSDGKDDLIFANHSYNNQQIEWFKEGSALNLIKKQN